jgi:hypothetical protein
LTVQKLYDWINSWRKGLGWPNRALYALADQLCDFELEDVNAEVLEALAALVPREPPEAGPWGRLAMRSKSAMAIIDGLVSGEINSMRDPEPSIVRSFMHGLLKRDVQ